MLDSLHKAGCKRDRATASCTWINTSPCCFCTYSIRSAHHFGLFCRPANSKGATQIRMPSCISGQPIGSVHRFRQCVNAGDYHRPVGSTGPISSHAKLDDLAGILTAVDGVYPECSRTCSGRRLFCIDLLSALILRPSAVSK